MRRRPRVSPSAYRRIALVALGAQVLIIVTGAAVRLTGSGLGCSDWPACEQDRFIAPMEGHALVEFLNRSLSAVVLIAVLAAIVGARWRAPYRRDLYLWSLGPLVGVLAQILLGGAVVLLELTPVSVIGHFLLSVVLLWNATVLYDRAGHPDGPARPAAPVAAVWTSRAMILLALTTIVTGTLVTATGPHGGDDRADRLGWFDIGEIARAHGVSGLTLLATTLAALWLVRRRIDGHGRSVTLSIMLVCQLAIGYVQYILGVPPLLVGLHVLGSALVWISVLRFHLGLFSYDRPADGASRPASEDLLETTR